ncbi:MAG: hypothetical protein HYW48_04430 [Deltaproteobacteria bacterium]|nr:hypothetical protein [Deltaproteobacteria bacterium]
MERAFMRSEKILAALIIFMFPVLLFAQGEDYTPPSSPELYDPDEPVLPAYVQYKKVKSHPYLGLGLGFGQSRHAGGGGSPRLAWDINAEAGYVKSLGSWTRMDVGLDLMSGQIGDSRGDLRVLFGSVAKIGYGYNLAENLHAVVRLGAGMALANFEGEDDQGVALTKEDSLLGTVWQLGFHMIVPTDSSFDILAGAVFSQYAFNVGDTDRPDGTTFRVDSYVLNVVEVRFGARWRL